jgi:mannose-6-phosphate isomerase-like protein (cupin superfamily)
MITENTAHYTWGANCDGWHLLKTDSLSVIEERMPPGTAEQLHFHKYSQQLFYILSGTAVFEIDNGRTVVNARGSLHVPNGTKHRILNESSEDLRFLVISEPKAHGDRVNIEQNI